MIALVSSKAQNPSVDASVKHACSWNFGDPNHFASGILQILTRSSSMTTADGVADLIAVVPRAGALSIC
jgi:hypothetical protein